MACRSLIGLLPPAVESLELQAERCALACYAELSMPRHSCRLSAAFCEGRVMEQLRHECHSPLEKYELLADITAMNYTLFYYVSALFDIRLAVPSCRRV